GARRSGRKLARWMDQPFDFGQEGLGTTLAVVHVTQAFALAVQQDERGESLDLKLVGDALVQRLLRDGQWFVLGEIDQHQHEVGPGMGVKLGLLNPSLRNFMHHPFQSEPLKWMRTDFPSALAAAWAALRSADHGAPACSAGPMSSAPTSRPRRKNSR